WVGAVRSLLDARHDCIALESPGTANQLRCSRRSNCGGKGPQSASGNVKSVIPNFGLRHFSRESCIAGWGIQARRISFGFDRMLNKIAYTAAKRSARLTILMSLACSGCGG